mmetsp:Transcript_24204/g.45272  ORF Transcript_24204/g.45272 Transcript_24204/m.45272 type:complete len:136 (-) Transcript_24204:268-675(-)|eukprot:CAMPEP_0170169974 /NCGR_PEP_ID=MMETSP0040_2-20121228/2918_1 /TAXON_ID=641309 /ORGANISM="Lotharella oceanica, Strain CCMP622" /LENGTH=135 /DNA_ID=CAMNT_0010409045 /DNA_START=132 /DNA_END=539 /DNA_ORIENTATION=+
MEDLFDGVLEIENEMREKGFAEGFAQGKMKGLAEGRVLGVKHGTQTSSEIGFYLGCALMWRTLAETYPKLFPKRRKERILGLIEEIKGYPLGEANAAGMTEALAKIRSKFKVLMSQLGHGKRLGVTTNEKKDISF